MKFKSLYRKVACTALALALVSPFTSCNDDDGNNTPEFATEEAETTQAEEQEVLEHMKMSVEDFATGQKQFALRAVVTGAIYATGPYVLVSDKKADNIWGEIRTAEATAHINMMYEAESLASDATLRISFSRIADTGLNSIFHALGALQEDIVGDIIYKRNDEEDLDPGDTRRDEYDYVITITFSPLGQTFSTNCAIIDKSGTTVYTWRSSGLYYVEPRGTSTEVITPIN